jgi:hypothetical protein
MKEPRARVSVRVPSLVRPPFRITVGNPLETSGSLGYDLYSSFFYFAVEQCIDEYTILQCAIELWLQIEAYPSVDCSYNLCS